MLLPKPRTAIQDDSFLSWPLPTTQSFSVLSNEPIYAGLLCIGSLDEGKKDVLSVMQIWRTCLDLKV